MRWPAQTNRRVAGSYAWYCGMNQTYRFFDVVIVNNCG